MIAGAYRSHTYTGKGASCELPSESQSFHACEVPARWCNGYTSLASYADGPGSIPDPGKELELIYVLHML